MKANNKLADLVNEFSSYEKCKYHNYKHIFTDCSKDPKSGNTGSVAVIPSQGFEICKRTSNNFSVHTVELYAILIVLEWVEQSKLDKVLICNDSVSALCTLKLGMTRNHELVYQMMSIYSRIKQKGTEVVLIGIPAHKGIMGNERVDKLALKKEILDTNIISRSIVWEKVFKEWQKQWDQESKGKTSVFE